MSSRCNLDFGETLSSLLSNDAFLSKQPSCKSSFACIKSNSQGLKRIEYTTIHQGNWKEERNRIFRIAKAFKTYSILKSNGGEGQYYELHFKCRAVELNHRALEFCFDTFEAQLSEDPNYFSFLLKKSYLPQISFCFVAYEPFWPQFRCCSSTSNTKFFDTLQPAPFLIVLNESSLPSSCTAFSQAFAVNWFQWRISDERPGVILVPRAYDPSGLRQESRALGTTISGMRHRCRLC